MDKNCETYNQVIAGALQLGTNATSRCGDGDRSAVPLLNNCGAVALELNCHSLVRARTRLLARLTVSA